MKEKTSNWYECKVRLNQVQENGFIKKVTETYVVESLSYTEAEARITEEIKLFTSEEFEIKGIKEANFKQVFIEDSEIECQWFKVKLAFFTIDERSGSEKKTYSTFLVQGASLRDAIKRTISGMEGTMADYEFSLVSETPIFCVYEYDEKK